MLNNDRRLDIERIVLFSTMSVEVLDRRFEGVDLSAHLRLVHFRLGLKRENEVRKAVGVSFFDRGLRAVKCGERGVECFLKTTRNSSAANRLDHDANDEQRNDRGCV